jgi:hypothetical protein
MTIFARGKHQPFFWTLPGGTHPASRSYVAAEFLVAARYEPVSPQPICRTARGAWKVRIGGDSQNLALSALPYVELVRPIQLVFPPIVQNQ